MTDPNSDPTKHLRPLQFSLRWMLIATSVMAVVFAVLSPYLRQFPTRNLAVVACAWSVSLAVFCVFVLLFSWSWTKECKKAGMPLFRIARASRSFLLVACLVIACGQLFNAIDQSDGILNRDMGMSIFQNPR